MDFMKVFDQTVREIKREVNLKVLKVPEIEQKVLDATDDEPWGPHGTVLAEIAQATKKFSECQMVMNVLWTRLTETGCNWRFVYKAKCLETGEAVAIKKVLRDKRYKNRELQTMRVLDHPNVVSLKHCFYNGKGRTLSQPGIRIRPRDYSPSDQTLQQDESKNAYDLRETL